MAKVVLNQAEQGIQSFLMRGEYGEAQKLLTEAGNQIRPNYRAIFAASIAFATGNNQRAWEAITWGLRLDGHDYELYTLLGDYYVSRNLKQAYLCYENALFYCNDEEDSRQIQLLLDSFKAQGVNVPKTAIVILSYNLLGMTRDCIESIRATTPASARDIIVVDNASSDGSVMWLKQQRDVKLLCNTENKGFPMGCNQGIGLADKDSDIFLLNNDTVMTDNAMFWLRMGLYESEEIGSTGSVSNHVANFQAVIEDGKDRADYLEFAKKTNIPMANPYLNKVHLVGFALLLKRSVLEQVGILDERFSPGNWEDNDICLRINLVGFRNVLCRNSFIIHWGSQSFFRERRKYANILEVNQQKFLDKWSYYGITPLNYMFIRMDLVSIMEEQCDISNDNIMVVGTGFGAILSTLQNKFPDAKIYGMEQHQYAAQIANRVADTVWVDLNEWKGDDLKGTFDIILVNDVLEYTHNPYTVLAELKKMLKENGRFIISFVNEKHYLKMSEESCSAATMNRDRMINIFANLKLCVDKWMYTQTQNQTLDVECRILDLLKQYPEMARDEFLAYQWIAVAQNQRSDIQFGSKMVICIPTCGNPEVVEDVLHHCAEIYKRYGIDVYYYDSSKDDETRKVIENYQNIGYDNLYYIQMNPDELPVVKFEYIFAGHQLQKEYEYMWFLRERCWCEEKTLKLMYRAMEELHDLIFIDVGHPNSSQELSICKDVNMFYHRCGDYATSMDTAIYNMRTILKEFDIEEFHVRHREYIEGFLQFLIIFERLSQRPEPDICLLAGKNAEINHSKRGHSAWGDKRIDIWGKMWIEANEALPDCYTEKDDVIKRTASMPWILGDLNALMEMHDKGILTPEYYEEIKEFWERVSNISLDTLRQISYGEYKLSFDPLQLGQGASVTMGLILQAYKALAEGMITPQSLPVKEILAAVYAEARAGKLSSDLMISVFEQVLENIGKLAEEKNEDKDRMIMLLQLIIGIQTLIEQ